MRPAVWRRTRTRTRRTIRRSSAAGAGPASTATTSEALSRLRFLPVGEETLQAGGGGPVPHEVVEKWEWTGRHVGAQPGRPDHLARVPDASRQHLGGVVVVREDLDQLRDHVHAVVADVVQ